MQQRKVVQKSVMIAQKVVQKNVIQLYNSLIFSIFTKIFQLWKEV